MPERPPRPPRAPGSLRARLTLATTGVVAASLVVAALLLVALLQGMLVRQRDDAARQQARDLAALVTSGRLPDPVPAGGTNLVQVVDALGRVRAASPGGDRLVPLLDPEGLAAARSGEAVDLPGRRIGIAEPLRVVGVEVGPASDRQTVLLAGPVTDLYRSLDAVRLAVAVAVTLLVLGAAALSRLLVGSAMRPVDELARGAAAITGAGSAQRLPVPDADDELRRLAVTLNAMVGRVQSATLRQRAFVSDAAHELRSPLASIRTALEVALHHPRSADWPQTAQGALEDVARMSRLVEGLLLLARIDEAGRPGSTGEPGAVQGAVQGADLAAVADRVVARACAPAAAAMPAVTRAGAAEAPVAVPPDVLTRIVGNLVENACRHARSSVTVAVVAPGPQPATRPQPATGPEPPTGGGGRVELRVSDDGPGIPEADRERVFERFTRLDDARSRDGGGSGLGLAIVRQLVQAYGGTVELGDGGPGLVAVVRLPAAAAQTGAPPTRTAQVNGTPGR